MKKVIEYMKLSAFTAEIAWKAFTVVVVLGGGTTAGVLAAGTQLFQAAGPLAWFGIAVLAALAISLVFYLVRSSQRAAAEAALATALASKPSHVNPLLGSFENLVIPLSSLHLPGRQLHKHKQFKRCKFVGPGAITLLGGTFVRSSFNEAGHVLTIPEKTWITGITVFENCTVEDCEFFQVTLLIPRAAAESMSKVPGIQIAV